MLRIDRLAALGLGILLLAPTPSLAEEGATQEMISDLERRVEELEAERQEDSSADALPGGLAKWARRVRVGGSASAGYYWGDDDSTFHKDTFQVWDARFFVDADLGQEVRIGQATAIRNMGFSFEWDLVRLGSLRNTVGELYVDFQGIADSPWLNLQLGRAQIPVGENYLRFSGGTAENPFISNTVGGPWFWDEGVRIYGGPADGRFGYVASIMDAEGSFNVDRDVENQYSLKLFANPTSWLHLSMSGLVTGAIGSDGSAGQGSLWLGEAWARAFGSGTSVPNHAGGAVVPDGPNKISETYLLGVDAVLTWKDRAKLWLGYGTYQIDQSGSLYDRRLHYWIAELLIYGSIVTPELQDLYVGVRANALGTYDSGEGYLLDFRRAGELGYNMESMTDYSVVLGWRMLRYVTVRAEFTHQDISMVRSVTQNIKRHARDNDYAGVEVGIHF